MRFPSAPWTAARRLLLATMLLAGATITSAADDPKPGSDSYVSNEALQLPGSLQITGPLAPVAFPSSNFRFLDFGSGHFPSEGLILFRQPIVPPGQGSSIDVKSHGILPPSYKFESASGTGVYSELCRTQSLPGFFSPAQNASILLDIDLDPKQLKCPNVESNAKEFVDAAETRFPESKIFHWQIGRIGFLLVTNRLIPQSSSGSDYGSKIDPQRLAALLTFSISANAGKHPTYPVDEIVTTPAITECRCDPALTPEQAHEILAAGKQECIERDTIGRACPGKKYSWEEQRRRRWYFNRSALQGSYLTPGALSGLSNWTFEADGNSDVFVDEWCQLDPFFPCTDISILALTSASTVNSDTKKVFAESLAQGLCPSCEWVRTQETNVTQVSVAASRAADMVDNINQEIDRFADGDFGFMAIPVGLLSMEGLHLEKILPIDLQGDDLDVVQRITQNRYPWIRSIDIAVASVIANDKNLFSYFRLVATHLEGGRPISCYDSELECLLRMNAVDSKTDIDWFVQH